MWSRSTYKFVDLYYVWGSSCVEMGFTIMSMSKPAHQKHPKENVLELLSLPWVLLLNADLWELWNSWSGNPSVNRNMFCSLLFFSSLQQKQIPNLRTLQLPGCEQFSVVFAMKLSHGIPGEHELQGQRAGEQTLPTLHLTWVAHEIQWLFDAKQLWYNLAQYLILFWTASILS